MYQINQFPTARISVGKNVLKTYPYKNNSNCVYLKDKTEFQIELFNPTSYSIVVKFEFNGKDVSDDGLILKPGERVFIERFLNCPQKFIFNTYNVDGNDEQVKNAIRDNGNITVKFYKEKYQNTWLNDYKLIPTVKPWNEKKPWEDNIYCSNTLSTAINPWGNANYYSTCDSPYNSPRGITTTASTDNCNNLRCSSMETGRIEKGSTSLQQFSYENIEFEYFPFHQEEIKLLPQSEKKHTVKEYKADYRKYCSNCGKRLKYTDNYCSRCGQKA